MFQRTKLCKSLMLAFGGSLAIVSIPSMSQTQDAAATERVEVTGSRIKRAESEGALPITIVSREQLEASGATTVAEFVRTMTFASTGNFRPQSGSSAQSFAGANLRGLGEQRTLVLLDGRRLPKAPNVGDSVDMNSIPMAAVERIEVLTDGASAVYGSDAIGGVINIITKKNFEGVHLMAGYSKPTIPDNGGQRTETSALIGMSGEKGRVLAGFSRTDRNIVYTRDYPYGKALAASSYGNNFYDVTSGGIRGAALGGAQGGVCGADGTPNEDTNGDGFWVSGSGLCLYDFNKLGAEDASITNTAVFAMGEYQFHKDWSAYLNTSVSRVESFGRYAPTPGQLLVSASSPNNTAGTGSDVFLRHRFSAVGTRDNYVDSNLYDMGVGVRGSIADGIEVDVGGRVTESRYSEVGKNYIYRPGAEAVINSGEYSITDPYGASEATLAKMRTDVGRNSFFKQTEVYGSANFRLGKLAGGNIGAFLGAEMRTEDFADKYDALSEAGLVEGSAGNSSSGDRTVRAVTGELVLPVSRAIEVGMSARYEDYSDFGGNFAPKVSGRWKPIQDVVLRASVGKGFRAPSLPALNAKQAFSAESVSDPATCAVLGCVGSQFQAIQIDAYSVPNPGLKPEESTQFSFGGVWDATTWLSVKADYWNIKIKNQIKYLDAASLVERDNGGVALPIPSGLYVSRASDGSINAVGQGYVNEGVLETDGIDLNVATSFKLGRFGQLRSALNYSYLFHFKEKVGSVESEFSGTEGTPRYRANVTNSWSMGPFDATWNINVIGKHGPQLFGPEVGTYVTHDLQFGWDTPIKGGRLTVGILNVANKSAPGQWSQGSSGRAYDMDLYDLYGRTPYFRFDQKF